jgi:hypothetical protein
VQATNVMIENNLAYVSYDVAGEEFSGGVYIIDISNPRKPQLMAELTAANSDFYALTKAGNQLFLSGASLIKDLSSPAFLQVLNLDARGAAFSSVAGHVDLPSFAATDVTVMGNDIYVTTGDKGGGVAKLNKNSLKQTGFYPLEDARSVSVKSNSSQLAAFKGSGGELHLLNTDLSLSKKINLPNSATLPVSQSTIAVKDNIAVVGAGNGGTIALDLNSSQILGQIKAGGEGITNGASIDGNYVFMAEGFDGVGVAQLTDKGLQRMGSVNFKNDASANVVKFQNNVLFVANGKGGLRILTVENDTQASCPGKADIVFVLDGGNSPSTITKAVQQQLYSFIDRMKASGADVTFSVASTAANYKKHPHNDEKDATKLVLNAVTDANTVKTALANHPHIAGTSMDTYSALVETLADPTVGDLESDQVKRRRGAKGEFVPLIQIVITDHQPEQQRGKFTGFAKPDSPERERAVADFAKANNSWAYFMLEKGFFDRYDQITEATGGRLLDIKNSAALEAQMKEIEARVLGLCIPAPTPTPQPSVMPSPMPSPVASPEPTPTEPPTPTDPCYGNANNWVVNGGFETPVVGRQWGFVKELGCWKIGAPGHTELDPPETWTPFEGQQSLDLNPDQPGEIYQDIYTLPGQDYRLSFAMAGNINSSGVKSLEVFWADQSLGVYSFDTTGKSAKNMGWKTIEIPVPGSLTKQSRTRMRFKSLTANSSTGPVIDNVIVK